MTRFVSSRTEFLEQTVTTEYLNSKNTVLF